MGVDIVIVGCIIDIVIIVVLFLVCGCYVGGVWYGVKIGECGVLVIISFNIGIIMISFDVQGFIVEFMGEVVQVMFYMVLVYMFYENFNFYQFYESGGYLDVMDV